MKPLKPLNEAVYPQLRLTLLGAGAMGEAILSGLLTKEVVSATQIMVVEPSSERQKYLEAKYKIQISTDLNEAASLADVIILAVKPQMIPQIVPKLCYTLQPGALAISIAAGVPLSVFASYLVDRAIVRAMPNTPAQIGAGMTVWTATPNVTKEQNQWAQTIFQALGQELYVEDEHYLDMATALNGSGPAYIFLILEAMIDAGVQLGFTRPKAQELVYQTMLGSVLYAQQTGLHPAQLRNAVTSPGGTTAAALSELERGNIRTTLNNAIWAAYNRACALGKREEP